MVRTRGGSRLRPRVRFSTPERETSAPVPVPAPSPVPEVVPEEPLGFRHYQTRMGPRAPSPVPRRRVRRAWPSKRARTSSPSESSSSRPPLSPVAGVHPCQLERDSWCNGCYLLTGSYTGCPGSEVGPVPFYADSDYDPPGSSSCSWSARGAHH